MIAGLFLGLSITIATSSGSVEYVSASASGGSSAEASVTTVTSGGRSTIEVNTEVDGVAEARRVEHIRATSSASSSQGAPLSAAQKTIILRTLDLVRSILARFGLSFSVP